ncbi:DDE-type integrase/transposase/recombinase, partial [Phytoactinopolyspora sp. XMNu-373]|nr:DDE-type integrase/transposase/recombinase [Phytoactinopolyspora mesophila]
LEESCIFHSDRGSQYTSDNYSKKLKQLGMRASLGRTGICYDNGVPRARQKEAA